ncbi:MAG: hypothetical protein HC817_09515 [Saprospiraceae bacterium]|nr:hypothetical protein [Saprospiraceae bacterium]
MTRRDFNENINKLRQAFRDDAFNSDVFTKARTRAQDVMDMILAPTVRGINRSYKVSVRFQNNGQVLDYDLPKNSNAPTTPKKRTQTPQNQGFKNQN